MDPAGVACRDLRDCLLYQLRYHQAQLAAHKNGNGEATAQVLYGSRSPSSISICARCRTSNTRKCRALGRTRKRYRKPWTTFARSIPAPVCATTEVQPRLIEPDVAFIKHGDEWLVMMNEDDVPVLRLNPAYKCLLTRDTNDKDTRNYVKERYKSAIQLIKNIEQRKQTITKVCYAIVTRQQDFLEKGIDQLKPMMIKEVAEEIGVHPLR